MLQLNQTNLKTISPKLAESTLFNLPEKILQFGTGVLLRGLCDDFVDKANKAGIFNGRIVVVKSTDSGDADAFETQNGLYTICVRGIDNGKALQENRINTAISRVLSAKSQWGQILACAENPAMQIVVSNTTEVGIQYVEERIEQNPPSSFPAKLLAFLHARFKHFSGSAASGMVIVPTELVVNNGDALREIVLKLAQFNQLEKEFIDWLNTHNTFCNSLVDRIVPGKPSNSAEIETELGYKDDLLLVAEVYRLWAIQGGDKVRKVLSFAKTDKQVIIEDDIEIYRELKLRLLNGTHTLTCGLAYLSGKNLVRDNMQDDQLGKFVHNLMLSDLAMAIPYKIDDKIKQRFGLQVLDRFRNPFIEHKLLSITVQYTAKMKSRNIPLLLNYYKHYKTVPQYFALGFAAYLWFMKTVKSENGQYFGQRGDEFYLIQCDAANYFHEVWQNANPEQVVEKVLSNENLWGTDLTKIKGFQDAVRTHLSNLQLIGATEIIGELNAYA